MPDYKKSLKINKYDLLNELVKQPQKYMEWVEISARANIERDEAKTRLDIVKAEVEADIREDPEGYDLGENPKEGAIKAAIIRDRRVKKAQREYMKAIEKSYILTRAETAFHQRKSMLTSLVQLDIRLHFADVTVPKEVKEEMSNRESNRIKSDLKGRKITRRDK